MSLPAVALAVLLLLLAVPATAADIAGTWEATEFDPLFGDNAFFGQFHYRMEIVRAGEGYAVRVARTGSRFAPAPLRGNRLVTTGSDANRGPARLDITFADGRFSGTIAFGGGERRIEGTLAPGAQLATAESSVREAEAKAESAAVEAVALRTRVAALRRQVDGLTDRLARESAARRAAEAALAAADKRVAALERQGAASRPPGHQAAAPAPPPPALLDAGPAGSAHPLAAPTLELIEPPYDPATDGPDLVTHEVPTTRLVGRVGSASGLLSLRLNGHELEADRNGLFSAAVAIAPGGTPVRLVAIDHDGRRTALTVTLRPPPPPEAESAAAEDAAGRCYRLGIAAETPTEAALAACRQAVADAPEAALNHYNLAVVLSRLGHHQEAILSYQEAAGRWAR